MRRSAAAAAVVLVGGAAAVGIGLRWYGDSEPAGSSQCVARVGHTVVHLNAEQAHNAALIAAVGMRRGLPARATSIALAAAYQESKITNVRYGDLDSLGLFQQRPSQGWGSRQEILDPYHATGAFYDALQAVPGYTSMPISQAAQSVQRSADGSAYQQHESEARALASALSGYSRAAFTCTVAGPSRSGSADAVTADVRRAFGQVAASASDDAAAVDLTASSRRRGWALAQYLVANADRLGLRTVSFDGRVWSVDGSDSGGWRSDPAGRDQVHATLG